MRILMTGGGTAGHVNPALAIASTIQKLHPEAELLFVASALPQDKAVDLVSRAGLPLRTVHIRGLRRPLWHPNNLGLPFVMLRSRQEAASLIRAFKPDLIVGTGGFACWPLCSVGKKMGVPTVLHESNAVPGKAVMRLRRKVDLILVNFREAMDHLDKEGKHSPVLRVGNPMMEGFTSISREEARSRLGLSSEELFVLSFGGSMGAEGLNDAVVELAEALTSLPSVRLHHAAGKRDYERTRERWLASAAQGCDRMTLVDYIYDMPLRMAAADLVISRAGAMSVSELALMGKAVIFVPSPYVPGDHQHKNAMSLTRAGAALCVREETLGQGRLTDEVCAILKDAPRRREMQRRILDFAVPDANQQIHDHLMGLILP